MQEIVSESVIPIAIIAQELFILLLWRFFKSKKIKTILIDCSTMLAVEGKSGFLFAKKYPLMHAETAMKGMLGAK